MTKPRALNYGLGFYSVDIVSIYDAEDRPDPNQIEQAAASHSNVVCPQGVVDICNSDAN